MLEMLGIPYTCSKVQASAIAMDKVKSKIMYELAGIPTAASINLSRGDTYDVADIVGKLGSPTVVKPATEGSALGVEIVENPDDVAAAIERVFEIDDKILLEQFLTGTEITVAVLGNDDAYALPIIQIVPMGEFYDFESKYAPGGSKHICPAPFEEDVAACIKEYAVAAHHALGCSGVSRSDFIVDADGKPWILETNTIPGMTATSLLPDAARAAGMSFPELCTALINYALE
jgi:D-alanine-D-alanine ligase